MRYRHTSASVRAPRTASPSTTAASGTFSAGRIRPSQAEARGGERHRQGPTDGAQVSLEADFADQHEAGEPFLGELATGDQDADRDGKVEA